MIKLLFQFAWTVVVWVSHWPVFGLWNINLLMAFHLTGYDCCWSFPLHPTISRPPSLSFLFLSFHWGEMGNISLSSLFSLLLSGNSDCWAVLLAFNKLLDPATLWKTTASITQNEAPHNPGQPKGVFNNYLLYVFGESETSAANLTERAPKHS